MHRNSLPAAKCPYCSAAYIYEIDRMDADGSVECKNCGRRFEPDHEPQDGVESQEVVTICPFCNAIMDKGYIVGAGGIYWNKDVPTITGFRRYSAFGASLGPTSDWNVYFFRGPCPHLPALKCRACGRIVIEAPEDKSMVFTWREKCPYCDAVYSYSRDKVDVNGTLACQNCGRRFRLSSVP
ncbi:MAG: hypothetical protein C4K47_01825 [Candidatus Thorarchaeota archaeon]|nr:MAG: hypothetical protein C4K47_01825 [Candidatus Thorarchaeota archaeon]